MEILTNILVIIGVLATSFLLAALLSYIASFIYIKLKRRIKPTYHYSSPIIENPVRRDFDFSEEEKKKDEGNAIKDFKEG